MNKIAKQEILDNLRNASPSKGDFVTDNSVIYDKKWTQEQKIERFCQVTSAVNTQIKQTTLHDAQRDLIDLLTEKGVRHLMQGSPSPIAKEITDNWTATDTGVKLRSFDQKIEACKEELFSVDASLTTTVGAIAETGSLILWPTREEPRLLSLVPPVHVALVYEDRFFNTFLEAIEQEQWTTHMPTNALLISGPSKTSDIEQELCYGVHGPKELVVMIIRNN
ncbi:LutC/YkgG family protein [Terasakiella sp.]|uniref:LutC/YkgG family protein n=1 Tax=Terasakiella sp. TaxID=2034861 RepID=UPI003AA8B24F